MRLLYASDVLNMLLPGHVNYIAKYDIWNSTMRRNKTEQVMLTKFLLVYSTVIVDQNLIENNWKICHHFPFQLNPQMGLRSENEPIVFLNVNLFIIGLCKV
jgi:hypothetical protein